MENKDMVEIEIELDPDQLEFIQKNKED